MDYSAAQKLCTRYRSRLTRLQNQKHHARIIALWEEMQADFDRQGFPLPASWSRWQRAADDARLALQRAAW
jgi:hypothetical protein